MGLFLAALLILHAAPASPEEFRYPGSRLLLDQNVVGTQLEIHWRCYATPDPVVQVAKHYEKDARFAPGAWRMTKAERGFQLKVDPDLHVAIFPIEEAEQHPNCKAKLEPGERTVLQISQGIRRPQPGK